MQYGVLKRSPPVPKQVDHAQRRNQLAEALWTIAERDGLAAATVRKVAAEAGVSVGMVQHYFSTKDEMLLFALNWVGEDLGQRLTARVTALPEPREPYDVVWIVLSERLPAQPRSRVYVQALVTWLSHGETNPELAEYMLQGTRTLRDYVAGQLRGAQQTGDIADAVDPVRTADGLLALADGLSSHLLQDLHTTDTALNVLAERLGQLFNRS